MKFKFISIEELTQDAFKQYPIWIMYEDPDQNDEITSWGVDFDRAWENKTSNKEEEYYYPYMGEIEPPLVRGTNIYCKVKTKSELGLFGLLIGGFAFVIYSGNEKFQFNINMPDIGRKKSKELCRNLGINENELFPLSFTPISKLFSGKSTEHEKYW